REQSAEGRGRRAEVTVQAANCRGPGPRLLRFVVCCLRSALLTFALGPPEFATLLHYGGPRGKMAGGAEKTAGRGGNQVDRGVSRRGRVEGADGADRAGDPGTTLRRARGGPGAVRPSVVRRAGGRRAGGVPETGPAADSARESRPLALSGRP